MAENADNGYTAYPVFKGLQKPLEFLGIQGRYIYWAAGTAGGAIVGFITGLVILVMAVGTGAGFIMVKQRRGLHSKKTDKGIFVYTSSKKI